MMATYKHFYILNSAKEMDGFIEFQIQKNFINEWNNNIKPQKIYPQTLFDSMSSTGDSGINWHQWPN